MAQLSADGSYVIVEKGDTLSQIAKDYGKGKTYQELADLNGISDPGRIAVGQKIKLSGTPTETKTNTTSSKVKIKEFGLQSNTDRTIFVTWTWDKSNTDHYEIKWYYATGDGVAFVGSESTAKNPDKQSIYTAPENATKVKVKIKPISKKKKVNGKETDYWTADWSTEKLYTFVPLPVPGVPSVKIKKYKLTAELRNLDPDIKEVEFQVVKNDKSSFQKGVAKVKTSYASFSCDVTAGGEYKVRARSVITKSKDYGEWSEYSENFGTIPLTPDGFVKVKAKSETEVYLDWNNVKNVTGYEVQYTTEKRYFDSNPDAVSSRTVASTVGHTEITGLAPGDEYFFRVRAVNDNGTSGWTEIISVVLGKDPAAPTTWSSTTTAKVGEIVKLYWIHNAEDGSKETKAQIEIVYDGEKGYHDIENTTSDDDDQTVRYFEIDLGGEEISAGGTIKWRVRTAGITGKYGDWSTQRTLDVYEPPTISIYVDDIDGEVNGVYPVEYMPVNIMGDINPIAQKVIGLYLSVVALESYEIMDETGNKKNVRKGDVVYARHLDLKNEVTSDESQHYMDVYLYPSDVHLENNITYKVECTVSMNSGLTAKTSEKFKVAWAEDNELPEPNASVYISDDLEAVIYMFCLDEEELPVENTTLALYRREYDGTFTEIASEIPNTNAITEPGDGLIEVVRYAVQTHVIDPHPALDYARYRIVVTSDVTGAVNYYDMPGIPVGESAVVIQWDEEWSNFDISDDESAVLEEQPSSRSMLRLPYNINVSNNHSPDVSLIEYIGRKYPVSYYGTQVGETATWSVEIPKTDTDTLYALRRLAKWMGDVYVREPSGSGYWANIVVSFSQSHKELTIPVTLSITRVEGGM